MTEQTNFQILNAMDVSEHVEQKMNLSYLSWAWAHGEMKKFDDKAQIIVHEFVDNDAIIAYAQAGVPITKEILDASMINYKKDKGGAYVTVTVTIKGAKETEMLPVMDFKNKSMVNPTSMDVNKAIKRCFVKALALHGLGLYIYSGSDLPEQEPVQLINVSQIAVLSGLIEVVAKSANKSFDELQSLVFNKQSFKGTIKQLNIDEYGTMLNYLNQLKSFYEKKAKEDKAKQKEVAKKEPVKKEATPDKNVEQGSMLETMTNKPIDVEDAFSGK